MLRLHQIATATTTRPSALLGIDRAEDELLAFELDNAILGFGRYVEGKLEELTPDGKRKYPSVSAVLALQRQPRPRTAPVKQKPKSAKTPPPPVTIRRRKRP